MTFKPEKHFKTRLALDLSPSHRVSDALAVLVASFASLGRDPLLMAVVMILGLQLIPNFYRTRIALSTLRDLPQVVLGVGAVTFIAVVLTDQGWTATGIVRVSLLATFFVLLGRFIVNRLLRAARRRNDKLRRRTVILGAGATGWELCKILVEHPEMGLHPVAVADKTTGMSDRRPVQVPLKKIDHGGLADFLSRIHASTLIVAFTDYEMGEILELLRDCSKLDTEIYIVPRFYDYVSMEGTMDNIYFYPVTRVRRATYRSLAWYAKRPLGALISGVALLLLSPFFSILALLIKMEDPSAPVLFRQIRVGVDGEPFALLKFRSMTPKDVSESDSTWNIAGDPRITKLGAFMRKYSIDELPQLFNVFRGDMALVGPRPERPSFVEEFSGKHAGYHARHRVPVGLTGWAAAHGLRGDTSIRDRAKFDNFYIENWSLWLDIKIIILTISSVIKGSGS